MIPHSTFYYACECNRFSFAYTIEPPDRSVGFSGGLQNDCEATKCPLCGHMPCFEDVFSDFQDSLHDEIEIIS